jgi:hypothetical protein
VFLREFGYYARENNLIIIWHQSTIIDLKKYLRKEIKEELPEIYNPFWIRVLNQNSEIRRVSSIQ